MRFSPFSVGWRLVRETTRRWSENDGNLLAASMAYYAAFSFFPLMLVIISGLGFALQFSTGARDKEDELLKALSQNVAPALAEQVANILSGVRINASVTGPVGLGVMVLAAIAMFNQLDFAFDRLWRIPPPAGGIWRTVARVIGSRLTAFLILCALGLLMISALLLGIVLSGLHQWADQFKHLGTAWDAFELLAFVMFHTIVFTVLYKALPKTKVQWKHALAGGLWVATIWEIGRLAMSYIIVGKNYTPYGVVGSFIAIMVWVYYASSLTFLGAQFVEVLENPHETPKVRG